MKKLIKLFSASVLALIVGVGVVACSGNNTDSDSPDPAPAGTQEYVFEAEYVSCDNIGQVDGWSGGGSGTDIVAPDTGNYGASNGFYVTYLYTENTTLEFKITSDKDVNDAKLVWRVSAEGADYTISTSNYKIKVNDTDLQFAPVQFKNVPTVGKMLPFKDYTIATSVSLKKGENTIQLITANSNSLGGTTTATAPIIDCIKITTSAVLTWEPVESNIENF